MITWVTEKRKVSDLIPAPYNPREMTEKQVKDLTTSLERFNLADPIVINTDNTIIGGHQRIKIYQQHGKYEVEVDVRVPSRKLNPQEEKELNLRLNRNLGQWDFDALANFDEDMLKDIGFDSKELDRIFQIDTKPEDDDVPDVRETSVKLGDMFKLGEHILLCGDSTKKEDVQKLMQGENADLVFTSPPYNCDIDYNSYPDKKSKDEYLQFLSLIISNCFDILSDGRFICWNVGTSPKTFPHLQGYLLEHAGFNFWRQICWEKSGVSYPLFRNTWNNPKAGNYRPNYQHELIYLFTKGIAEFRGEINPESEYENDVWKIHQSQSYVDLETVNVNKSMDRHTKKSHPAAFPVNIPRGGVAHLTIKNEIIYDPFGGSGTTIIACEKLNRKCRMMEIDCVYVDVIIRRWETFTGQKAIKL